MERINQLAQMNQLAKPFEETPPEMIAITPIPKDIRGDIKRLSWIKHAVDAGYPEGLFMLHGNAKQIIRDRNHRKTQSEKAEKPRGIITQIIRKLALSNEHKEDSHKELWKHFFFEIRRRTTGPTRKTTPKRSK